MNDRVVNVGLIGGSGYAMVLLDCLEVLMAQGAVKLVAAAVLPKEQGGDGIVRAKANGTRIFDDWEQMLEATRGELDLCVIPTGIAQHRPMATRALELGHRVFVEKPLAGSFEDGLAIAQASQQHGDKLSVGYQDIYQPSVYAVRERIRKGEIGKVRSIRGYGLWRRDARYYGRNGWAGRVRVGDDWVLDSPLNNALAHHLNLMLFLASPHDNAVARFNSIDAELYRARAIENFDTGSVRINTEQGFPIEFHVTHSCAEHVGPFLRIEGENGHIEWQSFRKYEIHTPQGVEECALEGSLAMRINMFQSLLDWVHGLPSRRCTAAMALGQSLCISMLHRLGAVEEVAAKHLDPEAPAGTPVIKDIDAMLVRCFEQGGLPSEHGAAWGTGVRTIQTPPEWAEALALSAGKGVASSTVGQG